jgi:hypothetical protein
MLVWKPPVTWIDCARCSFIENKQAVGLILFYAGMDIPIMPGFFSNLA